MVAENQELSIEIIVNKIDLASDSQDDTLRRQFAIYERIGYPVHYVSARQGVGIDDLKSRLTGIIAAVAGNSGVGKSSLLNVVQPGLKLKTGEVSLITHKGRHTTTQAELIPLFDDGESWLADTPGLQHLDFWEIDPEEVEYGFREVQELAPSCQFNNCTHRTEPGCAVREAVRLGTVDERRLTSYGELYNEACERAKNT